MMLLALLLHKRVCECVQPGANRLAISTISVLNFHLQNDHGGGGSYLWERLPASHEIISKGSHLWLIKINC